MRPSLITQLVVLFGFLSLFEASDQRLQRLRIFKSTATEGNHPADADFNSDQLQRIRIGNNFLPCL